MVQFVLLSSKLLALLSDALPHTTAAFSRAFKPAQMLHFPTTYLSRGSVVSVSGIAVARTCDAVVSTANHFKDGNSCCSGAFATALHCQLVRHRDKSRKPLLQAAVRKHSIQPRVPGSGCSLDAAALVCLCSSYCHAFLNDVDIEFEIVTALERKCVCRPLQYVVKRAVRATAGADLMGVTLQYHARRLLLGFRFLTRLIYRGTTRRA